MKVVPFCLSLGVIAAGWYGWTYSSEQEKVIKLAAEVSGGATNTGGLEEFVSAADGEKAAANTVLQAAEELRDKNYGAFDGRTAKTEVDKIVEDYMKKAPESMETGVRHTRTILSEDLALRVQKLQLALHSLQAAENVDAQVCAYISDAADRFKSVEENRKTYMATLEQRQQETMDVLKGLTLEEGDKIKVENLGSSFAVTVDGPNSKEFKTSDDDGASAEVEDGAGAAATKLSAALSNIASRKMDNVEQDVDKLISTVSESRSVRTQEVIDSRTSMSSDVKGELAKTDELDKKLEQLNQDYQAAFDREIERQARREALIAERENFEHSMANNDKPFIVETVSQDRRSVTFRVQNGVDMPSGAELFATRNALLIDTLRVTKRKGNTVTAECDGMFSDLFLQKGDQIYLKEAKESADYSAGE